MLSWERMLRDQPDYPLAVNGLAEANAAVKAAKSTIESGRTHSERLQTAVTRQTQAQKEFNRADSEHSALIAQVDESATRLAVAVAALAEAQETLVSLQVEGAGPQPVAPAPIMQAGTFFAAWSEIATRLGWHLGDPAAFNAMAAAVFAQSGAMAAGSAVPGLSPGPSVAAAPLPFMGPVAAPPAGAVPAAKAAAAPSFCPGQFGHTFREAQGMGIGQGRRSRSAGPSRWRRPTGLDVHFNTTGVPTPSGGAWAAPPPHQSMSPPDASGFSTPHSQRSRSRSPVLQAAPLATGAVAPGSVPSL